MVRDVEYSCSGKRLFGEKLLLTDSRKPKGRVLVFLCFAIREPCIPGNDKNKMADVSTVMFSGSSAETIEHAKAFWKSIEPLPEPKSTLVVTGINHRLQTAANVPNGL